MLFDLDADYHELHDLSQDQAHKVTYTKMMGMMADFLTSVAFSQANETGCRPGGRPPMFSIERHPTAECGWTTCQVPLK